MRNALFAAFAALTLGASLQGAEAWKSKPVPEWTREETIQFFRTSPWVRQVSVSAGPSQSGQSLLSRPTFEGMTLGGQGCLSCAHIEPRVEQPRSGTGGQSATTATTYLIQWTSARIVRQGFAHLLTLQGQGAEDSDPAPLDVFVVTVGGVDLQAFEGIEESELQKEAWLRPKKSKAKVSASRINVLRGNDGRISVIHFGFPREQDSRPVIDDAEKTVEFRCRVRDQTLKAEFDLRTMVLQGIRDL